MTDSSMPNQCLFSFDLTVSHISFNLSSFGELRRQYYFKEASTERERMYMEVENLIFYCELQAEKNIKDRFLFSLAYARIL